MLQAAQQGVCGALPPSNASKKAHPPLSHCCPTVALRCCAVVPLLQAAQPRREARMPSPCGRQLWPWVAQVSSFGWPNCWCCCCCCYFCGLKGGMVSIAPTPPPPGG